MTLSMLNFPVSTFYVLLRKRRQNVQKFNNFKGVCVTRRDADQISSPFVKLDFDIAMQNKMVRNLFPNHQFRNNMFHSQIGTWNKTAINGQFGNNVFPNVFPMCSDGQRSRWRQDVFLKLRVSKEILPRAFYKGLFRCLISGDH